MTNADLARYHAHPIGHPSERRPVSRAGEVYIWQMNDGRFHISVLTDHETCGVFIPHGSLIDRGWDTRVEAENALASYLAAS